MRRFEVMRQLIARSVALFVLAFLLVPAGFSKTPANSKAKKTHKSTSAATTNTSDEANSFSDTPDTNTDTKTDTKSDTKTDETATPAEPAAGTTALPAQT